MEPQDGQIRVVIDNISPQIDNGRFPVKRVIGDTVTVHADIFADGHDTLSAMLLYCPETHGDWSESPMLLLENDRWSGAFTVTNLGCYRYTITAWINRFLTWRKDLKKRIEAGQEDIEIHWLAGTSALEKASLQAPQEDTKPLQYYIHKFVSQDTSVEEKINLAFSEELASLMALYDERRNATLHKELLVRVERQKARYSAWYEMFPRSTASEPGRHGTFQDCETLLPYIAGMGFDVLYLPPIHPVGSTDRKGKNNTITVTEKDPGTPWAIGSEEGGHTSINSQLGTLADFTRLVKKAGEYNIEIALDIAFQCSPDHPYVREHPDWFLHRPDGTIQYAENPPKKYQDIYPLYFESTQWKELWQELKSIFIFWIDKGIRIFRVDNPHTKPFPFWEWCIAEIKKDYPDVILLSEAFTRPRIMYRLAKLGFTQSYTYFAWRTTKKEIEEYLTELSAPEIRNFFIPNFWPNTPDILHEYLQSGKKAAFITRLVLAATLSSNYGIYGPAFELMESTPREPDSEEYLNSEKYELKYWDRFGKESLREIIAVINGIRRNNPALQDNRNLWFNATDNDELLCYSKHTDNLSNIVMVVVNLNPHHTHSGWVNVPVNEWDFDVSRPYEVHDLLTDTRYIWQGEWNFVELNPAQYPIHIFSVNRNVPRVHTEKDFDYYL